MKKRLHKHTVLLSLLLFGVSGLSACGLSFPIFGRNDDLSKLSDIRLYENVYIDTLNIAETYANDLEAVNSMSIERKIFFVLSIYDMEIQCGGLSSFFVNSSRDLAPYVSEALEVVGALEHQKLYNTFINDNKIDVNNLDSFKIQDMEEYEDQTQCYDFESFNNQFIELTPIQNYLVAYVRNHMDAF